MKFKTNAKCMGCVNAIRNALSGLAPAESWQFDLESPDKIMEFTGETNDADFARKVTELVKGAGFIAEKL